MVGDILYFLHRHVRIATPIALVILTGLAVLAFNLLVQIASVLLG